MKKGLLIILFVLIAGGLGFSTFWFWKENKNQIQQNQTLAQQNASIQAQLNAIGDLVTVYEVSTKVYSGKEIKETDLVPVSVPASTCNTSSITDISQLVGKFYKIDILPGTILSSDMLMEEKQTTEKVYSRDLTFESVPVSTVVGDYIDIRIILPNGEEYVVLSHEQIMRLYETTITIHVSEEENAILNAVFADLGSYQGYVYAYMTKYLEPGKDTDTVAFYPVQHEMENYILFNPNIKDTTRCINTTLRDHIDEVLLIMTDSMNQEVASSFISSIQQQNTAGLAAHQLWIQENTDEDGNLVVDGQPGGNGSGSTEAGDGSDGSFEDQVGGAMDSLEDDLADLEAIQ